MSREDIFIRIGAFDGELACEINYTLIEEFFTDDVGDIVKLLRKAADSIEQCFSSDKDVVCLTRINLEKESVIPAEEGSP